MGRLQKEVQKVCVLAADLLPTWIKSKQDEFEYDNHSEQGIEINDTDGLNGLSAENISEREYNRKFTLNVKDKHQDVTRMVCIGEFVINKLQTVNVVR